MDVGEVQAEARIPPPNALANPAAEIRSISRDMSASLIEQEIKASFVSQSGSLFNADSFFIDPNEPASGDWVVAVDLAGFTRATRQGDYKKRDETAITIAKVNEDGWWVKEIVHGRWEVRETALRIFQACRSVGTSRVGIEKGALMNAIGPYLEDETAFLDALEGVIRFTILGESLVLSGEAGDVARFRALGS